MPGSKRTAAAAATLAFSAVPLPLAPGSHPAKPARRPSGPAPVSAPKTRLPPAPASKSRHGPVASVKTPQMPVAAKTPRVPAAATRTWSNAHPARVQHDVRLRTPVRRHSLRPRAHAAGDPANTITDFKFSPGTTTIHVGDTITWTNSGPSPHTATANDGSFETGTLSKGASASHTFTHSGTFAYICKIHPFMHGTVVVLAAASTTAASPPSSSAAPVGGSGANTSASSGTPAVSTAAGPAAGPTLPVTGLGLSEIVGAGLALLALGWCARRFGRSLS